MTLDELQSDVKEIVDELQELYDAAGNMEDVDDLEEIEFDLRRAISALKQLL